MADKLRIGIIGAGFMGKTYAATIARNIPEVELTAVSAEVGADEIAGEYKIKQHEDWRALADSDQVDAVLVATPQSTHEEMGVYIANAGKHVMLEKPMARTPEECDAIIEACDKAGVKLSVAQTQRHRVCNYAAREVLDSGRLGKVLQIRSISVNAEVKGTVPRWNLAPEQNGLILGHSIHHFDAVRYFSAAEPKTVFARVRNLMPKMPDGTELPSDGTVDALIEMTDGSVAYVLSTWEAPKPGIPGEAFNHHLICSDGLALINAYTDTRIAVRGGEWEEIAVQEPIDWAGKGYLDQVRLESYTRHLKTYFDAITGNTTPPITGWDGRQAVAMCVACYESSRTGKAVELG